MTPGENTWINDGPSGDYILSDGDTGEHLGHIDQCDGYRAVLLDGTTSPVFRTMDAARCWVEERAMRLNGKGGL